MSKQEREAKRLQREAQQLATAQQKADGLQTFGLENVKIDSKTATAETETKTKTETKTENGITVETFVSSMVSFLLSLVSEMRKNKVEPCNGMALETRKYTLIFQLANQLGVCFSKFAAASVKATFLDFPHVAPGKTLLNDDKVYARICNGALRVDIPETNNLYITYRDNLYRILQKEKGEKGYVYMSREAEREAIRLGGATLQEKAK